MTTSSPSGALSRPFRPSHRPPLPPAALCPPGRRRPAACLSLPSTQIPLFTANVSALKAKVLSIPEDMWGHAAQQRDNAIVTGRADNMNRFKPGVDSIYLIFSDQSTKNVFRCAAGSGSEGS